MPSDTSAIAGSALHSSVWRLGDLCASKSATRRRSGGSMTNWAARM